MFPKETSEINLARFSLELICKGFQRFALLGQMFPMVFSGGMGEKWPPAMTILDIGV